MDTKRCSKCHEENPIAAFRIDRRYNRIGRQCKACENIRSKAAYHRAHPLSQEAGDNYIHPNLHHARRSLVVAIAYRAYEDGRGNIAQWDIKEHGQEGAHQLVMDGRRFFEDGRWQHFAELIDIDPFMVPVWKRQP